MTYKLYAIFFYFHLILLNFAIFFCKFLIETRNIFEISIIYQIILVLIKNE
jgi:hypothetical protein